MNDEEIPGALLGSDGGDDNSAADNHGKAAQNGSC